MSQRPTTEEVVRALGELGRTAVPVEEAGRAGYRRERVVRAMERQIDVARAARPQRKRLWMGFAVAALAVLGVGAVFALGGERPAPVAVVKAPAGEVRSILGDVSVRVGSEPARPLTLGRVFEGGEVLRTASSSGVEIGIETGRARLVADSELEVVRPTPGERRLRLGKGGVDVDLPVKLARGQHLVIETPDADVLVVGTAFTVDLRSEGGQRVTAVEVRRGTVWVQQNGRQAAVLHAGQHWRSGARAAEVREVPPELESEIAVRPRSAPRSAGSSLRAKDSGTLAEENRLFESALSARNAGDNSAAAEQFRVLLSRYPGSILAEQALAGQFRSLERAGRTSTAVVAARRYLAKYPQGFARADAERLTTSSLGNR
jgi:hypothetical protein